MPTPYALSSDLVSAWPAKSLEVATYLDTALAAKTDTAMTQNAQTGTSYSYALADASKLLSMSNAASNTVLVTKQATVTWVTGTQLRVVNLGAGVTTLVADTGVTINGNVSLKQYQGGTLIRTASDVWLFVPTASSSGVDLITPTSVAGSGVTLSGGEVSMSAATTASINGCFTSAYQNYIIMIEFSASTGMTLQSRLRLAGTDATAAAYVDQSLSVSGTGVAASRNSGATLWASMFANSAINNAYAMQLFSPSIASATNMIFTGQYSASSAALAFGGSTHSTATAYDGISFIASAGNFTGKIRVYGLRNS